MVGMRIRVRRGLLDRGVEIDHSAGASVLDGLESTI